MTEQVFARAMHDGLWQWQICDAQGQWINGTYQTGDSEALVASLPAVNTPVNVVVRGQKVVSTQVSLDAKQGKHAAKLIPFELEDELSGSVDELHFAYQSAKGDQYSVLYADQVHCAKPLNELGEQGCEIPLALPEYLFLRRPENGICLLLEDDIVCARLSRDWGFSIELELVEIVLERLAENSAFRDQPPSKIELVAENEEALAKLVSLLPEAWRNIESESHIGGFWDGVEGVSSASGLNLRSGKFARQLPVARWWNIWKRPSYVLVAAFVVALLVNIGFYYSAKSKEKAVLSNINEVYLDAVPGGRLGDVEGILESKLKTLGSTDSAAPTNLVYLLSKVTEVVAKAENAKLTNFNYNGEQMYLQLTLEADSLSSLGNIRSELTKLGVHSESPRTTSLGDGYQARMRVSEIK